LQILICQNLRNNLQHPNEYIRGVTLRFLCRIHEEELLEPLVPSVIANLEHRHSYVRKNAVLALAAIYRLPKGELLVPDAPEFVEKLLNTEQDLSTRRNAFQMLCNNSQERAVAYLFDNVERLVDWGDILQLAVLDLIRKVCRAQPEVKGRYIKIILALLQSRSTAVVYECATTLVSLSSAPTAVRAAAQCFCQLLVNQSDNNVKLIVLDRLAELKERHRDVMAELLMDMLRALSAPNLDVRRKVLDVALDLVTSRSVDEVVGVLKKEAVKTQGRDIERGAEYRSLLVRAIHQCAVRFPDVAASVLHLLMDFLSDPNAASALDVAHFIREIAETNPKLHDSIVERLMDTFPAVRLSRVAACLLWVISEFCTSTEEVTTALEMIKECLGPLPFLRGEEGEDGEDGEEKEEEIASVQAPIQKARPVVLADGSYATQTAIPGEPAMSPLVNGNGNSASAPSLRSMLLAGDFFLGAVLSSAFTKMVLRLQSLNEMPTPAFNRLAAELMLIVAGVLRLGGSASSTVHPMDDDVRDRMAGCLHVMASPSSDEAKIWLDACRASFEGFIAEKQKRDAAEAQKEAALKVAQPDELIDFRHLKSRRGMSRVELEDAVESDLAAATGMMERGAGGAAAGSGPTSLSKVVQLTGFSDPIYAEAYVTAHRYDIVLDVLVINRTGETMQNVSLELATMGDLKLVERPQAYTLAPGAQRSIRANIKVSSTETGAIFGNLVYESTGRADRSVVVLSDIHIDIMDYIVPAICPDIQFRSMWAEFEWENKVAVNTSITDPHAFLDHIVACTNMRCLTPPSALDGDCGFLAANLYARSVFGEDALVNVSVEKLPDGKLGGYIRIRSKTQGIALSLGDKLIIKSKG
jgi:coatomer subunit beta